MNKSRKSMIFHRLIKRCPLCNKTVDGHSIYLLASIILNEKNRESVDYLESLILNCEWLNVSNIKQGNQEDDVKQYHVLNCPINGRVLLSFVFTYGLWSDDWIDSVIHISNEDFIALENIINFNFLAL
jgi:hypothetical protein